MAFGENLKSLYPFCEAKKYAKGSVIFRENDEAEYLLLIETGRVKIVKSQPGDRSVLLYIFMPGEVFGFLPFLDEGTYPATAIALDEVEAKIMNLSSLKKAVSHNPDIALVLLGALATKLRQSFDTIRSFSQRGAKPKVATALLALIPSNYKVPIILTIPEPAYEFAQDVGLTPETFSRELSRMVKSGILNRMSGGLFQVLDIEQLKIAAMGNIPV
jgi:CRP-like cAMP-binding protein